MASPTICSSCLRTMQATARLARPRHALLRSPRRAFAASATTPTPPSQLVATFSPRPRHAPSRRTHISPLRHITTSAPRPAAILNPRTDETGAEMTVGITPRAAHRLNQIMTTDSNPHLLLRITVESGGCHGFQYLMSLTTMPEISQTDDTVFEGEGGARIVLDEPSLELLKGSKVDYAMELIGSQFKIVDNPAASSSCGCGTSFDVKV